MADQNPTGRGETAAPRTAEQNDFRMQGLVLGHILVEWPTHLRIDDLVRELADEECGFADRDATERAVRDLCAAGLLFCSGPALVPTKAAVHFNRIRIADQ